MKTITLNDLIECIFNLQSGEYTDDFNMGINCAGNKIRNLLRDNRTALEAGMRVPLRFKQFRPLEGNAKTDWYLVGKARDETWGKFDLIEGIMYRSSSSGLSNSAYEEYFKSRADCESFAESLRMTAEFVEESDDAN